MHTTALDGLYWSAVDHGFSPSDLAFFHEPEAAAAFLKTAVLTSHVLRCRHITMGTTLAQFESLIVEPEDATAPEFFAHPAR